MRAPGLLRQILAHRLRYVAANMLISGLGFVRNVLFMKLLGLGDLGQVAMMQTTSMSIGLLQFGLVNGAYRIYASGDAVVNRRINDTVFTCLSLLGVTLLVALMASPTGALTTAIRFETLAFGIAAGVASLFSNWVNNALIAEGRLGLSNLINLGAATASLAVAAPAERIGLPLALAAVLIQPMMVALLALVFNPVIRPKRPCLQRETLRQIMHLGFIPFCAGILSVINLQVERWFIAYGLGAEPLGRYYIVMIYATIFSLVPASLLNLYFPKIIRAFESGLKAEFLDTTRRHARELLFYTVIVSLLTVLLLGWALDRHLPNYRGQQGLVFLSIPGLVALTFFDTAALVQQATRKLRPLFLFGALALLLNTALLGGAVGLNAMSLEFAAIAKSVSYVVASASVALPLFFRRKTLLAPGDHP